MIHNGDLYTFSARHQTYLKQASPIGVTIEAMLSTLDANMAEGVMCLPEHTLFITLASDITFTETFCETDKPYRGPEPNGSVSFAPANLTRWSWHTGTYLDWVAVFLDPQILVTCLDQEINSSQLDFIPFTNVNDPLLYQLVLSLKEAAQNSKFVDLLYIDSVATTLSLQLIRQYSSLGSSSVLLSTPRSDLRGHNLYQVVAYINDQLSENITLEALAQLVGMSKFSFCRAFKQAIGKTPYQYLLHQRIRRATALLANPELSLADIAFAVGFYDHSHFTNQFRRIMGVTPSAYRKAIG